ncbi:MAG: hypothetical protein M1834_003608 [Cirrosporium novae-zelandiae]|nr:MAG: hypothetical protein M1834_003608 [Cirrosporium novae-zelandiae]
MAASSSKTYLCIPDESTLIESIDQIEKWVLGGSIALYIPMPTLEKLQHNIHGKSITSVKAGNILDFLDRASSSPMGKASTRSVTLQGPEAHYTEWTEVQKHLLPEYRVKSKLEANIPGVNKLSQQLLDKLNFQKPDVDEEPFSSITTNQTRPLSSASTTSSTSNSNSSPRRRDTSISALPPRWIRPLLNSTLWYLHHIANKLTDPTTLILLSNDEKTRSWAQKYGIATKSVAELAPEVPPPKVPIDDDDDDDEEVVFNPRQPRQTRPFTRGNRNRVNHRPRRSITPPGPKKSMVIKDPIDPNSFSRNPEPAKADATPGTLRVPRGGRPQSSRGRGRLWTP